MELGAKQCGRVLVVDDDPVVRRAYERLLSRQGWVVDTTCDGLEAKDRMSTTEFDVVVTDLCMPGYGGIELVRRLRERGSEIPVIVITGKPNVDSSIRAIEYGVFRYLVKPIAADMLADAVKCAVKAKRPTPAPEAPPPTSFDGEAEPNKPETQLSTHMRAVIQQYEEAKANLAIAFQPIVRFSHRQVFGYEAHLRANTAAPIDPRDLMNTAEQLGRLSELARASRAEMAKSLTKLPHSSTLVIKIHARELEDPTFIESLSPFSGIAHRVVLKITDRAPLRELDDVKECVRALRQAGFQLGIDERGAGYGALTSIASFSPEVVHLGMNLVRDIDRDERKQLVVRSILHIAERTSSTVIASGIETPSERETLVRLGCDLLQGHLFAPPGFGFPAPIWR